MGISLYNLNNIDDTPPAAARETSADSFARIQAAERGDSARGSVTNAMNALTFGFADNAIAAGSALFSPGDFSENYSTGLESLKDDVNSYRSEYPTLSTVGDVSGGMLSGLGAAGAIPSVFAGAKSSALIPQITKGIVSGSAQGALSGLGYGDGDIRDIATGAGVGGITGGAFGALTGLGGLALNKLGMNPNVIGNNPAERNFVDAYGGSATPQLLNRANDLTDTANQFGIKTNTADALGLTGETRKLAANVSPERFAELQQAAQQRNLQVSAAVDNLSNDLAAVTPEQAGELVSNKALQLKKDMRAQLMEDAAPEYDAAHVTDRGTFVIQKGRYISNASEKVRDTFNQYAEGIEGAYPDIPRNSVRFLDLTRGDLLKDSKAAAMAGDNLKKRTLDNTIKVLDNQVKASLTPEQMAAQTRARAIYSEGSTNIDNLVDSKIGQFIETGNRNFSTIPNKIMSDTVSAEQAARIPAELGRDTGKAVVSGYLQNANLNANKSGNLASSIANKIKSEGAANKIDMLAGDQASNVQKFTQVLNKIAPTQDVFLGADGVPQVRPNEPFRNKFLDGIGKVLRTAIGSPRTVVAEGASAVPRFENDQAFYDQFADVLMTDRGIELLNQYASASNKIQARQTLIKQLKPLLSSAIVTPFSADKANPQTQSRSSNNLTGIRLEDLQGL